MPIRHCQKCGLKVLVDESRAADANFLCQRCTTGAGAGPAPTAARPTGAPAPAARGALKVQCPHCRASFSGSIPGKPAKGACPVCKKELIMLPDGSIHTSAAFDLGQWYKDQEGKKGVFTPVPRSPSPVKAAASPVDAAFPDPGRKAPARDDDLTMINAPGGDDIGGETMLGMGNMADLPPRKPPPPSGKPPTARKPEPEDEPMGLPGGFTDQTMLGMSGIPTLDPKRPASPLKGVKKTPAADDDLDSMPVPGGMGDHTMLGMGGIPSLPTLDPKPTKPPPDIEPLPELRDETMLGLGDNTPDSGPGKGPASVTMPVDMEQDGTMLDMGQLVVPVAPVAPVPILKPKTRKGPVAPPPPVDSDYDPTEIADAPPLPEVASDRKLQGLAKPGRNAGPASADIVPLPSGSKGKIIAAWTLVGLPLVLGLVLVLGRHSDGISSFLGKIAGACSKGFQKLHGK